MPTILLVMDDETLRSWTEAELTGDGYRVLSAITGGEALLQLVNRYNEVSLVLLTDELSDRTGREFYAQIRQVDATVPVLVISGDAKHFTTVPGEDGGTIEVIDLALEPEMLLARVKRMLARKEQLQVRTAVDTAERLTP